MKKKKQIPPINILIEIAWPCLTPAQRLALLLQILAYQLLNHFQRFEVRILTAFTFILNTAVFQQTLPSHPIKKYITFASAFYTAAFLLMVATWPNRRLKYHWVK